ncbi:MAG: sulfotransferase [Methylobacter sp.]|nr:sulfotransferase [Methylobacter sp.]MDP2427355.1 sulfotransferase [Methylobacter sp.]MDP3055389.1 sulfotransferase [Methylobacter sp.]MDP3362276.1 sulfotransferase [Methylobacter sp.]MDZ4217502.1 sulfotransferase [Methylobacter sp.]
MANTNDPHAERVKQPVFILSCVRSGSTMLRCIVDTHPNLCSPGHLSLGPLCANLYATTYYSLGKLPDMETEEQRDQLAINETRRVVEDILGRYTRGKGKKNWCEKSTINIDYLKILTKVFPQANYICLYRNCLDVAYSSIKFSPLGYMDELASYVQKHPTNLVAAMIDNWLDKTGKLMAFEQTHAKQCIRVNYESLVRQPEQVLAKLFDFLDEPWDEGLIESIFKVSHDQGAGDVKVWFSGKISKDSIGNGTAIPLTAIPGELMTEINRFHQSLGYPTIAALYAEQRVNDEHALDDLDLNDFFQNRFLQHSAARTDKFSRLCGVCKLVISGLKGGVWVIESNSDGLTLKEHDDESCDCTIATTYSVLCGLIDGRKTAVNAYEQGEITGDGNIIMALEFGRLLFGGVVSGPADSPQHHYK